MWGPAPPPGQPGARPTPRASPPGLITKRRSGRESLASGDVEAVRAVSTMLAELEAVWRGRVEGIDALLARDTDDTSSTH